MNTSHRRQHGFTLVELMISMTLGLLIILALITMLINVNRNNSELSSTNRLIENGRFAVQLMTTDVSHAGYWGGHIPQFDDLTRESTVTGVATGTSVIGPMDVPAAVPDPCLAYAAWNDVHKNNLIGISVQGTDIPSPVPSPTSPYCASVVTNPQPGTDVLVVRNVEPCLVGTGAEDCSDTRTAASPHVYFQPSRCSTDTTTFVLSTSGFNLKAGDCTAAAPVRRFSSSIYYVRNYASTAGDGIPTLVRARFGVEGATPPRFLSAQALVEGVENFKVEYGIDNVSDTGVTVGLAELGTAVNWASANLLNTPTNRGNGLPDTYISCSQAAPCTAAQLANATTVRIYVLARSEKRTPGHSDTKKYCLAGTCSTALANYTGPFSDGYKRHLFTQTIRLTNVASRRETP